MLLVQAWFHNSCTQALLGGGYLKADERNRLQSIIVKAMQ